MNSISKALSVVIVGSALLSAQSTSQPSGRSGGSTPAPNQTVNPVPQSQYIRILTPVAGQATTNNSIQLRYQLTNPAASAGAPNFQLQLDGADPVTTTSTEYTFSGLEPGTHSITVNLVDANGTPIAGGSAVVQFSVKAPGTAPRGSASGPTATPGASGSSTDRSSFTPSELGGTMREQPQMASNSLPMLSLIGFGVLIGGVASAFKTRG
jgi:hypothetical protein